MNQDPTLHQDHNCWDVTRRKLLTNIWQEKVWQLDGKDKIGWNPFFFQNLVLLIHVSTHLTPPPPSPCPRPHGWDDKKMCPCIVSDVYCIKRWVWSRRSKLLSCLVVADMSSANRHFYQAVKEAYEPDWMGHQEVERAVEVKHLCTKISTFDLTYLVHIWWQNVRPLQKTNVEVLSNVAEKSSVVICYFQSLNYLWEDYLEKLVQHVQSPLQSYTSRFPETKVKKTAASSEVFRPEATVSRNSLMESCTCPHCQSVLVFLIMLASQRNCFSGTAFVIFVRSPKSPTNQVKFLSFCHFSKKLPNEVGSWWITIMRDTTTNNYTRARNETKEKLSRWGVEGKLRCVLKELYPSITHTYSLPSHVNLCTLYAWAAQQADLPA